MLKVTQKSYIYIILLTIIVLAIGFALIRYIKSPVAFTPISPLTSPQYLHQPIPSIDKLKNIIDEPKFKELKHMRGFFIPVEVREKGRPNPFMPFMKETEPSI